MSAGKFEGRWKWVGGAVLLGGIGFLGWIFGYRLGRSSWSKDPAADPRLTERRAEARNPDPSPPGNLPPGPRLPPVPVAGKTGPNQEKKAGRDTDTRSQALPPATPEPRPPARRPAPGGNAQKGKPPPARPPAPVVFQPFWGEGLPDPLAVPPDGGQGKGSPGGSTAGEEPAAPPPNPPRVAVTGVVRTGRGVRVLVEDLESGRGTLVAPGEEAFGYRVSHFDERQGTAVLERGAEVKSVRLGENKERKAPPDEPKGAEESRGSQEAGGAAGPAKGEQREVSQ